MTKGRIAISVDRPVRDVFEGLAAMLATPPALATAPDSSNLDEKTAGQLIAVVAHFGERELAARYAFTPDAAGTSIDCAYEVSTRSLLASLGGSGAANALLGEWMQQDVQRIPRALREVVVAEAERDRATRPAPDPATTATPGEPTRITVRVGIKMKVQVPPGVKIDPARVEPPR